LSEQLQLTKSVLAWFRIAKDDLHTAVVLLELNDLRHYRAISFNSQQCVEKCLKGLLAFNKVKFDKTHELKLLSERIVKLYPEMLALLKTSDILSQYAVEYRYPDSITTHIQ